MKISQGLVIYCNRQPCRKSNFLQSATASLLCCWQTSLPWASCPLAADNSTIPECEGSSETQYFWFRWPFYSVMVTLTSQNYS